MKLTKEDIKKFATEDEKKFLNESENQKYKVRHKESGLTYILTKNEKGYYMSCDDGMVPSGQQLHGTLEEILQDYPLELVK